MKKLLTLIMVAFALAATAQDTVAPKPEPKLTFKPSGLVMTDGAVFLPDKNPFTSGVAIPEIRLGGTAQYGAWTLRAELGYAMSKLALKDVFLQYTLPENKGLVRLGYWVQQFGLQSGTSASNKCTMEGQVTDMFLGDAARNFGLGYMNNFKPLYAAASILCGTKVDKPANERGRMSIGAVGRLAWHPICTRGNIVQVGMSGWWQTAEHSRTTDGKTESFCTWETTFPTRVDNVSLLSANVSNARTFLKLTPEVLLSRGRFAFEGQYYLMNTTRHGGLKTYYAHGVYGLARLLMIGDRNYAYSPAFGCLADPVKGTLECVAAYNYTDASDAGIFGGKAHDVSLTFNYYINRYVTARLRWSYTNVGDRGEEPDRHVNMIQARVQLRF